MAVGVAHLFAAERASALTKKPAVSVEAKTLFNCRTDRLSKVQAASSEDSDQSYKIVGQRADKGEIEVSINVSSRALTLFVRSGARPTHAYVLQDVEQGSSLGSGASGHANTTIRGRSQGNVFTLFAGYENFVDAQAALQVQGPDSVLLSCNRRGYSSSPANGLGRYGSANIYGLAADGLAKPLRELPIEPTP